jgi:hypothetical protein
MTINLGFRISSAIKLPEVDNPPFGNEITFGKPLSEQGSVLRIIIAFIKNSNLVSYDRIPY